MARRYRHDIFICHASEDKDDVARPLAEELRGRGLDVWYDEFSLRIGDSLRQSIDKGLGASRFGVVILSPSFFQKRWPQYELDGLVDRQMEGKKVILPVWHKVGHDEVARFSRSLAAIVAARTSDGIPAVADKIVAVFPQRRRGRSRVLGKVSITEAGEVVAGPGTELVIAAPAARGGVAAAPPSLSPVRADLAPALDPIGGRETPLPLREEQRPPMRAPRGQEESVRGQIVNLHVSSWGQYDATIEWGATATMEVRVSLFREGSRTPEKTIPVTSLGLPGGEQTLRFLDLQPGTIYRIVAESDDDHQEVTVKTHEAWRR